MKRMILWLSVLLAMAGTAPASAAFLGANPRLGQSFLNTSIEQVAGGVSRERLPVSGGAWLRRASEFFVAPASTFTPKVTPKGIARVEQHLAQFGDDAANQAMIARLRAGQTTAQDITFYMHELKESAVMRRTQGAFSDVYEWQRAAHLETLRWQKIPYAPGVESQLYHPAVIRQFPQQFNPAAWPK